MGQLHVFFFPLMAHGHMIPTLDIAKIFASRGVKSTIITTPLNVRYFTKTAISGIEIGIRTIKFPTVEVGLPQGCDDADQVLPDELIPKFFLATTMLKDQIEQLVKEHQPNCLVADIFFPWATDIAARFKIPRLVFHGTSFFALCAPESLRLYKPQRNVLHDDEPFVLPNLPHEIKITRMQLGQHERQETDPEIETEDEFIRLLKLAKESELKSYGVITNSFYELEPDYADHYRKVLRRRAWHIGPVSLCNREIEDKVQRGKEATIDGHECLKWLNSNNPNSVIYVCFGSIAKFSASQLYEIAMGLEASGQKFIWVVGEGKNKEENENWLPEGFEERIKDKGLIIRGWAPQVLILDHEAVGGFVTHCGWNSTLEGITSGVPMVTWPIFAEQFYNEKLVTQVLKIGVCVGTLQWNSGIKSIGIPREKMAEAVKRVMVGEEAGEMRNRASSLKDMAKKAVEEGGSSYSDLNALLRDLSSYRV